MLLLYTYLTIAGLGLLSMPSFHTAFKAKHPKRSWLLDCDLRGKYLKEMSDPWNSQPVMLFLGSLLWPLIPPAIILYYTAKLTRAYELPGLLWNVLGLPGRMLANKSLPPQKDPYLEAGEREVEALLNPHMNVIDSSSTLPFKGSPADTPY